MRPIFVYPGSFCPPTYGHYQIMKKAARVFDDITIVCSENPNKTDKWFTPKECVDLWRNGYDLPSNVRVATINDVRSRELPLQNVVIIRGVRSETHFDEEKGVMFLNLRELGIDKFFYLVSDQDFRDISSSKARECATRCGIESIGSFVAPMITSALLEHALHLQNLIMVVGRPGSGKSTFLKMLGGLSNANIHINTDEITNELRPLLTSAFGDEDLFSIALHDEERLKAVIAKPWLERLRARLLAAPHGANCFVEIPYGLQPDKSMFRFIGGKILHIGCDNEQINHERVVARGTEAVTPFIKKIPDLTTSLEIAREQRLSLTHIDSSGTLESLYQAAIHLNELLRKEAINPWKTYSQESFSAISAETTCSKIK